MGKGLPARSEQDLEVVRDLLAQKEELKKVEHDNLSTNKQDWGDNDLLAANPLRQRGGEGWQEGRRHAQERRHEGAGTHVQSRGGVGFKQNL